MNKEKCAFAVYAKGRRYELFKENLVKGLKLHVPGVDVLELDANKAMSLISILPERVQPYFVRMAIPMMDEFRKYDRIVWIDVDTDVVSDDFAEILDVETSDDGLAAVADIDQPSRMEYLLRKKPGFKGSAYVNSGVMVFDIFKIDKDEWKDRVFPGLKRWMAEKFIWYDQDIFNITFDIRPIDGKFNVIWKSNIEDACLVHYADSHGHGILDGILLDRRRATASLKDRCVVVAPRHDFIRPWVRAYFASGNETPLVIVPGPPGDWKPGDMEYCEAAARYSGGCVFDCSGEWEGSKRLAERAARNRGGPIVGWYSKKSILHAVATRLAPKVWAWIDDDAEITGDLDECFSEAEKAPGFVFTEFYYPQSDLLPDYSRSRHPVKLFTWPISSGEKLCWNSLVFFHGDANERLNDLNRDFPVEDDEIIFGDLYKDNDKWHEGFCDFSFHRWQATCKTLKSIPKIWKGKLLHYTGRDRSGECKRMWAAKADRLSPAPFEKGLPRSVTHPGSPSYAAPLSTGPKYNPLVTAGMSGTAIHLRSQPLASRSATATDSVRIDLRDKALEVLRRRAK